MAADNEEIEQRHERQKCQYNIARYNPANEHYRKIGAIKYCQPFDFNRDYQKQPDNEIRKQYRKSEKHGKVEVPGVKGRDPAKRQPHYKTVDEVEEHAENIVYREFRHTPFALQRIADEIIEVKRYSSKENITGERKEQPGHKPPELAAQNKKRIKDQQIQIKQSSAPEKEHSGGNKNNNKH